MNWSNRALAVWTLSLLPLASNGLLAQSSTPNLVEQAQAAKESFHPVAQDQIVHSKQQLQQAMAQLDQLLARSQAAYAKGWKAYLHWDEINQALANDESANLDALREVYERFRRNNRGLEMPAFLAVRDRLRDYIDTLSAAREGKLQDNYSATIDDLAKRIGEYEQSPSGLNGPEIGRQLGWLQSSGQAGELVAAVENRFNLPNLHAQASERFLGTGFNEYVDRTTPVTDNILGTSIRGTGRFIATQVLDTVPSTGDARLNILLRGNISSRTVGVNGPATLHTTGITSVTATKQLVVNQNGVFAMPSRAACRTSTNINSISANCGLIEKIAWKKAGKQKGEAEAIASSHAAGRINGFVDREAAGPVARANSEFQERFRWPLLRRGHAPQQMLVNSGDYGIGVQVLQRSRGQIAAPAAPPQIAQGNDLTLQAHESIVANFSEAAIGGLEMTDEKLAQLLQENTGKVPEELQITDDKEPWSITFAEHYPIAAEFNGNQAKLYLRATRFTRGRNDDGTVDQEVKGLVQISGTYTVEKGESGVKLTRQGDVNVDFVGQEKLSAAQVGTKTFLRRKFSSLFKPEFVGEGLKLKGRFERAGTLPLRDLQVEQGWLTVAWQMP